MDTETRQRLLELVYDLLSEDEAAMLRRRIESEPEVAAAYREAQDTAKLLAEAARLPSAKIPVGQSSIPVGQQGKPEKVETKNAAAPVEPVLFQVPAKIGETKSRSFARTANWTVGMAAAVLVLISVGGYFYHRDQLEAIATEHLRLIVTGPSTLQSGIASEYTVSTTTIAGQPLPAEIEVALLSSDGKRLTAYKETADERGRMQVSIPADLKLPLRVQLSVTAFHRESKEETEALLAVEPVRYAVQLSLDKPLYQPGETVYYRSLALSRFGLEADRQLPLSFEIVDPSGATTPNSKFECVTERGVGGGAFTIPAELAGGQYTLVVRSRDDAFSEAKRTFFVRRYRLPRLKKECEFARDSYGPGDRVVADFKAQRAEGGAAAGARLGIVATVDGQKVFEKEAQADNAGAFQIDFKLPDKIARGDGQLSVAADDGGVRETLAKTIPIHLDKIDVSFYPEGGDLAPEMENRVYFVARNPLGKPVHFSGVIVTKGPNEADKEQAIAQIETVHEGMGAFSFVPYPGEMYRLKITSPLGVKDEPKLPEISAASQVVLTTGSGVFAAEKPLEFNVRASKAGLPLVAVAYCRGVQVGQQRFATKKNGSNPNPVAINLDNSVGGVIRLTIFDYSASPPKPVAERLVYRRPARKLNVRAAGHAESYSPGEKVEMSLLATNEKNEPVPAVLGVSVVDDALLNLADDRTPSMPTYFLLTSEIEKPEDLEKADFYLSDEKKGEVPSAVALDLLLGVQGWRRFVEKSPQDSDRVAVAPPPGGGAGGPPFLYDNIDKIRADYEKTLADYQADRTLAMNTLTTASFFGGMGLVLIVAMLGLMRIVSGMHLWISAIGATTCCLIIGAILMDPARLTPGQDASVAFLSYHPPAPKAEIERGRILERLELLEEQTRMEEERAAPERLLNLERRRGILFGNKIGVGEEALPPEGKRALGNIDGLKKREDLADLRLVTKDLKSEVAAKGKKAGNEQFFRQYAHQHIADQPGVRSDFAETLFWNPLLIAGPDGKASIHFDLSDAITSFRLTADAHGEGRIGLGTAEIVSRIPFNLEPKLPLEVNVGDRVDVPLAVVNDTKKQLSVELKLDHGTLVQLDGLPQRKIELAAGRRAREYFVLNVTGEKGECDLTFHGTADYLADAVKRSMRVVPPGFPRQLSYSGQLEGTQEIVVKLPESWVPGSLEVTLNAFPSTLADLQKGIDGILQEPNGCFEQASTSNYPNVMTMQYLEERNAADPDVTRRVKDLLKKGYARLTGYECKQKGYEWFGGEPGHEALTAYGLMQFRDMQRVFEVEPAMIHRTTEWLLSRRDGHGGFLRNPKALDSFGQAPADVTDAYIIWALTESGQKDIEAEVKHAIELGESSNDPYVVALAASTAINADKKDEGRKLLEKLAKAQADDGHLEGRQGSITRSGGQSLQVETTALGVLAWLKSGDRPNFRPSENGTVPFSVQADKAVRWIVKNRQGGGGFGSTQATILALKALTHHAKTNRRTLNAGKLIVGRGGQTVAQHTFSAGVSETISIDGLEANLKAGENRLTLQLTGNNKMPYAMNVSFRTLRPESSPECPVQLTTKLANDRIKAGDTVALTAELANATDQGLPMTVAILGLPAGLEPRVAQLEELKKAGKFDYYELRAREVIFYWRSLAPKRKVDLKLDLVAAIPGKYVGPASRAYLYYTSESKQWCDPLAVEISRD